MEDDLGNDEEKRQNPRGNIIKPYRLRITFEVAVMPWRINDPVEHKSSWAIQVWDENKGCWVYTVDLDRPGEYGHIVKIEVLDNEDPE